MERLSRQHDAFALTRLRESFAEWFASTPRVTAPSVDIVEVRHLVEQQDDVVVVRANGESHPVASGAIAGTIGGVAMLTVASVISKTDIPTVLGAIVSRHQLSGTATFIAGWALVMIVGAALGAGFGHLTRRLRNLPALLCFGMLLSGGAWLLFQTQVLARLAPSVSHALPAVPMILGALAFGLMTAMQLPLRTRRLS